MLLRRLYPYLPNVQSQSDPYLRAFFAASSAGCDDPLFSHMPRWTSSAHSACSTVETSSEAIANQSSPIEDMRSLLPIGHGQWDSFARAQFLETAHLLPGYILSSQGDRMAMAHGVEGRYPFLDPRVVAFASSLPARFKMKGLQEKYLLKLAVRGLVPGSILRRPKQPYRSPDASSFFGAPGGTDYVDELLAPARIQADGLFDARAVASLHAKARAGKASSTRDNMAFVGILSTQLLVDRFIRNNN